MADWNQLLLLTSDDGVTWYTTGRVGTGKPTCRGSKASSRQVSLSSTAACGTPSSQTMARTSSCSRSTMATLGRDKGSYLGSKANSRQASPYTTVVYGWPSSPTTRRISCCSRSTMEVRGLGKASSPASKASSRQALLSSRTGCGWRSYPTTTTKTFCLATLIRTETGRGIRWSRATSSALPHRVWRSSTVNFG